MTRNYFIRLLLGVALIAFLGIIFNSYAGARERALIAEGKVLLLEEERRELERRAFEGQLGPSSRLYR